MFCVYCQIYMEMSSPDWNNYFTHFKHKSGNEWKHYHKELKSMPKTFVHVVKKSFMGRFSDLKTNPWLYYVKSWSQFYSKAHNGGGWWLKHFLSAAHHTLLRSVWQRSNRWSVLYVEQRHTVSVWVSLRGQTPPLIVGTLSDGRLYPATPFHWILPVIERTMSHQSASSKCH